MGTSAKARIDTTITPPIHLQGPSLLLPTCPSSTPRSSDLPSLFKSNSTPPTANLLLRFSRTHNAEQLQKKERKKQNSSRSIHVLPSRALTTTPERSTYSHTHI